MKQQVFYIHGATSFSDYEQFLNYLRTEPIRNLPGTIESKRWSACFSTDLGEGFEVFTPSMPNKQNAKYEEWKIWFERHFEYLRDDLILVGWSQGGYFLTRYLIENKLPITVKALLLIAAPFAPADFDGEDGGDFSFDSKRVGEIAHKVSQIHLFHSKDDPVVPFTHAEQYRDSLPSAQLHAFTDRNHFLMPEFPELLACIKSLA